MRHLPWFACALTLFAVWSVPSARSAAADDETQCARAADSNQAIAACTRFIASGKGRGGNLAAAHFNRGFEYARKGDYDRAIADFNAAVRLDPAYANAYNSRGTAYRNKGDLDRAIADFGEALRVDPAFAAAYHNRALAFRNRGDYGRAIADYSAVIRLAPKDSAAYVGRGSAHDGNGDYDRAIADYNEAIRLDPKNASAYNNRAAAYDSKGDLDRAIADYGEALRLDPGIARVSHHNRGLTWYKKKNFEQAIADYSAAIRIDPAYASAYARRGLAYESQGELVRASADFEAVLALPKKPDTDQGAHDIAQRRLAVLKEKLQAPAPVPSSPDLGNRIALVIGNDQYEHFEHLHKAINDARAVSEALEKLGFTVIRVENATRRVANQKLVEFASKIKRGDTAFFFFAGHGVEIKGVNYLLPTDTPQVNENEEGLITSEGLPADLVVERIQERGARISILVLDACRENPFKKQGTRSVGGSRGLGRSIAPEGVFMIYSAGVGQSALDWLGPDDSNPNSVFTRIFLPLMAQRGLTMQEVAKATQTEVRKLAATRNHVQLPAYYDQILGNLVLTPASQPRR